MYVEHEKTITNAGISEEDSFELCSICNYVVCYLAVKEVITSFHLQPVV